MHHLRTLARVRYWKPIATGYPADDDTAVVERLGDCGVDEVLLRGVRLKRPVSPHLAARAEDVTISIGDLLSMPGADADDRLWVVEGAGGVRVPISDDAFMSDVILALDLPAVVVARSTLGTINHTLLTLEALRHRLIEIAGVIIVGHDADNRAAIERYGKVPILGEMPLFDPLESDLLRSWAVETLDRDGVLARRVRRWSLPRGVTV